MCEELFLTLGTVFLYLKGLPESRCTVEGEILLNAKYVFLVDTERRTYIFPLLLLTSTITLIREIKVNIML